MFIDHIGLVLFNNNLLMRTIGKVSFPIFAYQLVNSYFYTKNRNKLKLRMFLFSIISQPIFSILFNTKYLNILFSLLIALFMIDIFEFIDKYIIRNYIKIFFNIIILFMLFIIYHIGWLKIDWTIYGLFIIAIFYWIKKKYFKLKIGIVLYLIICGILMLQNNTFMYLGMLMSIILILKKDYGLNIQLPKLFGYFFYPLHLLLILSFNIYAF